MAMPNAKVKLTLVNADVPARRVVARLVPTVEAPAKVTERPTPSPRRSFSAYPSFITLRNRGTE